MLDPGGRSGRRPGDSLRAAHARTPGCAGAGQRRARRRGAPADQRSEVRDARAELERPDHGPRSRQRRPLPEPIDRARAGLHRRRGGRPPVRAVAASRRAGPPAATAQRRRRCDRPQRGDRLPPGRQAGWPAPFRDPAHRPAQRQRGRRDRAQRTRRQRAQGVRGAARPPGVPRLGHASRQPGPVQRARPPRGRAKPARRLRDGGAVRRSRRLQDRQRQPRPRGRRSRAPGGGAAHLDEHPRGRHRRQVRGRRVRRPTGGRAGAAGRGRDRRADPRVGQPPAFARGQRARDPRQPRHLRGRGRQRQRCRRADPQRRRRDVHRKERWQGRLSRVRTRHARTGRGAPRAAGRPPEGARARGVRPALPAAGAPRRRRR